MENTPIEIKHLYVDLLNSVLLASSACCGMRSRGFNFISLPSIFRI